MEVFYEVSEEPIVISKATLDRILKEDNPAGLIGLYMFYYYTAKWQKTNQVKATTNYVSNGLKMSEPCVRKLKKILIDLGLIADITAKKDGKIVGHYIKVNYIWHQETTQCKNHTVENPQCGHSGDKCLITNNINALKTNNKIHTDTFFEQLWAAYPKPVGKKAAYRHYKASVKTEQDKKDIASAMQRYIKSPPVQEGIQKGSTQYIQNGSTWFNNWKDYLNLPNARPKTFEERYHL